MTGQPKGKQEQYLTGLEWKALAALLHFINQHGTPDQTSTSGEDDLLDEKFRDLQKLFAVGDENISPLETAMEIKNWSVLDEFYNKCIIDYIDLKLDLETVFRSVSAFKSKLSDFAWEKSEPDSLRQVLIGIQLLFDRCLFLLSQTYQNTEMEIAGEEKESRIKAEQEKQVSEERLSALFNSSNDQIFLIDQDFRILYINHTPPGISKRKAIGSSLLEYQPPEYRSSIERKLRKSFKSGRRTRYNSMQVIQGEPRYYQSSVSLVKIDGNIEGAAIISRDITIQKRAELELKSLNESLEKLVEERTGTLKAINAELESFSYTVSHDLRAPLRAIAGFARILESRVKEKLSSDELRYLDVISSNVEKMGRLIDDLLAFSRMGKVKKVMSFFSMEDLTRQIFDDLTSQLEEGQQPEFIIHHPLPPAMADREMMKQVFSNLLGNAIKFSSTVKDPRVEFGSIDEEGEEFIYYIRDNGVGFEAEYAHKLFGIFQRLHSDDEFEGTGVGLAIVQRIIHRHHGRVWAEGSPGKGAVFYFSLPKKQRKEWI